MLEKDASKRPDASEVLKDAFFSNFAANIA
jgi:hypothetical protein